MNICLRADYLGLGCVLLALAACGPKADSSNPASPPQADAALVAEAVSNAAESSVATHPLCETATYAEVQAVLGGAIGRMDVINESTLDNISCIYIDANDLYNGLSIKFVTTERLAKTASQWPDAAAYFAEWGRRGTTVAGLGDGATWSDSLDALLVHKGDYVVQLSSDKADLADAAVRAKFETLAQQILPRLP